MTVYPSWDDDPQDLFSRCCFFGGTIDDPFLGYLDFWAVEGDKFLDGYKEHQFCGF